MDRQAPDVVGSELAAPSVPVALPRGPHQLTRDQVTASQRIRLLRAFTELLADRGYEGIRIGELAARAGVSRSTFYEHFSDKQECLAAAYAQFAACIAQAITPEVPRAAPWSAFVEAAVDGYLDVLQRDLTSARAFVVQMDGAGPQARELRRAEAAAFADRLAEHHARVRSRDRSLGPLPRRVHLALALAARSLVHDMLESEREPDLRSLGPDIVLLADAVVLGAGPASAKTARTTARPARRRTAASRGPEH